MRPLIALVLLTATATPARSDFIILDLPGEYTPGSPFTVGVGLAPMSNLGLYNVELVFRTQGPVTGLLAVDPPLAAPSRYVFPDADNFLASAVVSGTDYRLTLSDFTLGPTGTTVLPGVNDRLTTLTVRLDARLTGPVSVFVEPSSLQLDDPDGNSLLGSGAPPAGVVPPAVPAPAGLIYGVIALATLAGRRTLMSVWK